MRRAALFQVGSCFAVVAACAWGCGGNGRGSGFGDEGNGNGATDDGGGGSGDDAGSVGSGDDGPSGTFGSDGGATNDVAVTDCAVDANDQVWVNTESVIYKAQLPQSPGGTVQLTRVAGIALKPNQRFYALAFAPAGALDANEVLVGGDGNGELWSIDTTSGTTKDLGNFGPDPNNANNILALSGDIVFYMDAMNKPMGLATIRSCKAGTSTCTKTSDYLAGIDMANLKTAYQNNAASTALLSGIYGGSMMSTGSGTMHGSLFGLGAWQGSVYGFERATGGSSMAPPALLALDTSSGQGSVLSSAFNFTNGWSGAGVTTKVTITIQPPPPPPPPPH